MRVVYFGRYGMPTSTGSVTSLREVVKNEAMAGAAKVLTGVGVRYFVSHYGSSDLAEVSRRGFELFQRQARPA